MKQIIVMKQTALVTTARTLTIPAIIADEGERAAKRFVEFFTANYSNANTRAAYARAVATFLNWCEQYNIALQQIEPVMVAAYFEQHPGVAPTKKQHLAALRALFDWLVVGQVVPVNPVTSVRGERYSQTKGKTPILSAEDTRRLLDSIKTDQVVGLRDRAFIAVMVYSFARVSAVVKMRVKDYYPNGKRYWLRLHEKGGKFHEVPAHHLAEQYLDEYLSASSHADQKNELLFRAAQGQSQTLTNNGMTRIGAYKMIQRRATDAGIETQIGCHTFRATGITNYLSNGGTLEKAQIIAAHSSPQTTKLYDRTRDVVSLNEIERIRI